MKLELESLVKIVFLVLALCSSQAESFAIKTHSESKTASQNSNNDTLIFAHVVSKATNSQCGIFVERTSFRSSFTFV